MKSLFQSLRFLLLLLSGPLVVLSGCGRSPPESPPPTPCGPCWFQEVTHASGLRFDHDAGPSSFRMPRIMGSGGAFLDFDMDGRLDILLVHNAGPTGKKHQLFHQTPEGAFVDISAGSGIDVSGYGMGVCVGDIDNDGWVDVYISGFGDGKLFRNKGKDPSGRWLAFEEITRSAGVDQPRWGSSCSFVDYDRDGFLDLIVVNYVDYDPSQPCGDAAGKPDFCHPGVFPGTATRLFHNRGRDGAGRWRGFEDATLTSGLASASGPGLGILCTDFDGDGWPDLLVANDARPNHLWINQKNGTFREEAARRGIAVNLLGQPQANMGIAWGDLDGDGLCDVFVTHLTEESHALWRQSPRGYFLDGTSAARLTTPAWRGTGFGTTFADFDHDGWLDLALVNGRVARGRVADAPQLSEFWRAYAERNQLFINEGRGQFRDISEANRDLCGSPGVHRGLIWGDFDNDGAVDLLVTTVAGRARLFRNVAEKRGHWLMVRAVDPVLKRDAHGARIEVRAGGRRLLGEVCPGQSYQSSGDPRVHLGLGQVERIDELRVAWPDGLVEIFPPPAIDRQVTLYRGRGQKVEP